MDQNSVQGGQQPPMQPQGGAPGYPNAPMTQPFQPSVQPQQPVNLSYNDLKPKKSKSGLIAIILLSIMLASSLGFAGWAFVSRQDYKNNSDQKSAQAVEKALAEQKAQLQIEFDEAHKQPFETYSGPSTAGSIKIVYPRTWSAYVTEDSQQQTPVNGYFHPGFVPKTLGGLDIIAFALRVEVVNQNYGDVLRQFEPYITQGSVRSQPVSLPGVSGSLGTRLSGAIAPGISKIDGTLVVMPIRDKTLKIWTESNSAFLADFDNTVLPNLTYIP